MKIVDYFESECRSALVEKIAGCDWGAARFLAELLTKNTFDEMLGGWGHVYLLMEGEELVSFLTLSGQDAVRDESLTPWVGFVFTAPEYRGHRYAGQLLAHAENRAAELGWKKIYLCTTHEGLYEKYGYNYQEDRTDYWGGQVRVFYKNLEA